jgi:hypothetical protein
MTEKKEIKVKEEKRVMYVNPFALGVIVGAFSMLISIVILALITTGKKGK